MGVKRRIGLVCAGAVAMAAPLGNAIRKDPFSKVEYVSNYDGDTVLVNIPGLPEIFGHHIPVRIAHIDTPEIISDSACEKKLALVATFEASNLLSKAKKLTLINPQRDKYFRVVADILVDGKKLVSEHLLSKKLAFPYEGGAKPEVDWCKYSK